MPIQRIHKILTGFEKIHLEEMDRVQLMNRVDTKFTFSIAQLEEILPELAKNYKVLEVENNLLSEYVSLYYDDKNLGLYKAHHRKRVDRFKVRFRKYVSSGISFLEVKHKVKGRTEKSRITASDMPLQLSDEQSEFIQELGLDSADLVPSLENGFHRITLVNKTDNERLTLDINLTFRWQNEETVLTDVVIAELKQEKLIRTSPFYALMKKHLIRPQRISKYCIGIIKAYGKGNVKYNRFKKKLLKLKKIQNNAA